VSFPNVLFVGMEPAVKPAAEHTRSGVVGVLATPATFQGELYTSVVERFGSGSGCWRTPAWVSWLKLRMAQWNPEATHRILSKL
jgi:hypothetical protein